MIKLGPLTFYDNDDLPQGSDKWRLFRMDKVTASNAYKLLTKGKHAAILENKKPIYDNEYTLRGHSLEAEVREKLNQSIGNKGFVIKEFGSITNDKFPNCSYSPDGVLFPIDESDLSYENWSKGFLVEVKSYNDVTIGKDGVEHEVNKHLRCVEDINNVPLSAIVQMQFGMMVTERNVCYLVLYNPDCKYEDKKIKIWTINRDEDIINRLKEKLK